MNGRTAGRSWINGAGMVVESVANALSTVEYALTCVREYEMVVSGALSAVR